MLNLCYISIFRRDNRKDKMRGKTKPDAAGARRALAEKARNYFNEGEGFKNIYFVLEYPENFLVAKLRKF
jgi:hypothetical protein